MLESTVGAVLDKAFKKYKDHFAFKMGAKSIAMARLERAWKSLPKPLCHSALKREIESLL